MKRYGKRFLSLLVAVVMVLTTSVVMTVSVGATSRSVNDALAWCESQVGRALDYDGVYGAQCVDFIYYYYQYLGVSPVGGNASDYQYNTLPAGWQRFQGATPQPGDILVYANHVGVYASSSLMYHQAPSMGGYVMHDAHNYTYYNGYWGVIRPNFSQASSTPSVLTISGVRYPTYKTTGQPFEVFGVISSPNLITRGEAVVSSTAGQYMFSIFTFAEDGRYIFDLHDFDQHMLFASLPDGNYKYYIIATDSKGYEAYIEFTFTVGSGATASAYAKTVIGKHNCNGSRTWNSGSVKKAPTCTAEGVKTYTCTECKATKTESIAAKGHTAVSVAGTPATCTNTGLTSGSKCSVCNAVLTAQETIAALGHSFGEWSVKKQASCTEGGTESRACASCGITEDRAIAEKGHTAGNWVTVSESTCTQNGMKEQKCTECGMTVKSEAIPAKGHSYTSTKIPATPSSQGYTLHECKNCGDSYRDNYTDYINPNPNAAKAVIETKTAAPGDTVTVSISLENAPALKTLAIRDIVYDASKLELMGGKWNAEGAIIADWNQADKNAVLAFGQNTDVNGIVFTLTFKIAEETEDAEVAVNCKLTAKEKPESGEETEVDVSTVSGVIKISAIKRGDVNGDGYVDSDDAIYMLRFIMMPDGYPINQNGDFNDDGRVDSDDAIYLLYHVLLPDRYLLK